MHISRSYVLNPTYLRLDGISYTYFNLATNVFSIMIMNLALYQDNTVYLTPEALHIPDLKLLLRVGYWIFRTSRR
jgi:hypothetical protein